MFSEISAGKSRELTKKFTEFLAGQISSIQYSVHTVHTSRYHRKFVTVWPMGAVA